MSSKHNAIACDLKISVWLPRFRVDLCSKLGLVPSSDIVKSIAEEELTALSPTVDGEILPVDLVVWPEESTDSQRYMESLDSLNGGKSW